MINIPPMKLKEAGFDENQYVDIEAKKDRIIIKKKKAK